MSDSNLYQCLNGIRIPVLKEVQERSEVTKRYDLDSFFLICTSRGRELQHWSDENVFSGFRFAFSSPYVQQLSPVDCRTTNFTHFLICGHAKHPHQNIPANIGVLFRSESAMESSFQTFLNMISSCYEDQSEHMPPRPFASVGELRKSMRNILGSTRTSIASDIEMKHHPWLEIPSSVFYKDCDCLALQLISGKWVFSCPEALIEFTLGMQDYGVLNRVEAAIEFSANSSFLTPAWSNHRQYLSALGPYPSGIVPQQYCFLASPDICGISLHSHSRSYFPLFRRLVSPDENCPAKKLTRLPEFIRAISPVSPDRQVMQRKDAEKSSYKLHELFYLWKTLNLKLKSRDSHDSIMPLRIELLTNYGESAVSVCKRFFNLSKRELLEKNLVKVFSLESLAYLSERVLFWISETLRSLFDTPLSQRMIVSVLPSFLQRRCALTVVESLKCLLGGMEKCDFLVQSYHFHHLTRPSAMLSALFICKDTLLCHPRDCDYEGSLYKAAFSSRHRRIKNSLRPGTLPIPPDDLSISMILRCLSSLEILHDCLFSENDPLQTDLRCQYTDDWEDLEKCILGLLVRQSLLSLTCVNNCPQVQLAANSLLVDYPWTLDTLGKSFYGTPPGLHLSQVLQNFSKDDWSILRQRSSIKLSIWARDQPVIKLLLKSFSEFDISISRRLFMLFDLALQCLEEAHFLKAIPVVAVSSKRYHKSKATIFVQPIQNALELCSNQVPLELIPSQSTTTSHLKKSNWVLPWLPLSVHDACSILSPNGFEKIDYVPFNSDSNMTQIPLIDFISVCWASALTSNQNFLDVVSHRLGRNLISAKRTNWHLFLQLSLFPFAWRPADSPSYQIRLSPAILRNISRKVGKLLMAQKNDSRLSKPEQFLSDILQAFSSTDETSQVSLSGFHTTALLKSFALWRSFPTDPPLTSYSFIHDCLLPAMESCNLRSPLKFESISKEIYCHAWKWSSFYPLCEERPFGHSPLCPRYVETPLP
tara:strand:+ start:1996 stop:4959 length:2964 start_codon:yes stop_codon:yes gene_type:complete